MLDESELTGGKDIFIAPSAMGKAMDGDRVEVEIYQSSLAGGNPEGKVEKLLERASFEVIGTFYTERGRGYVIPESKKKGEGLTVAKKDFNGAKSGDKVVAKITRWPDGRQSAEGKITEIIGRADDPMARVRSLIRAYGMSETFPGQVSGEAERVPSRIREEETEGRRDLRNETIITMDGADAKDLDDAVSVKLLENGNYELSVHIADVSHYVKEGSALDEEALRRGCSVYLIDTVLPMLPQRLSNGICSLNPEADRLTLSISMEINPMGEVVGHEIFESIIHSKERMVYTDVSDLLEGKGDPERLEQLRQRYDSIFKDLVEMEKLAAILREKRQERGSLDFDFDEAQITLNEEGVPLTVETAERRVANKIIEEFMLAANETVAEHYHVLGVPFVYRIHETPAPDKMDEFKRVLRRFGLKLTGDREGIHPKDLNDILKQVSGQESEHLINTLMLRSMKKAAYGTDCRGHFGLGVAYYCHFTSPIRRYPDLIIHRIIKEKMRGPMTQERLRVLQSKTDTAAVVSSASERVAEELEREVENLKKAEYMLNHLGEEFDGMISGLSSSGIFVEIHSTIEGRVSLDSMVDDYYIYEEDNYRFIGRLSHKVYALGRKVKVIATGADLDLREIRFELLS